MAELSKKIGEMAYDGLVTDVAPQVIVAGGTILKGAAKVTYVRGTLFEKGADGKLYIFGTNPSGTITLTADVKPVQVVAYVGTTETAVTYNAQTGAVTFGTAPAAGTKNVKISYENPAANEPDCILCDDIEVGTSADAKAAVYSGGCFDPNKLVIAEGATITEAVKDVLREKGIILKAASAN